MLIHIRVWIDSRFPMQIVKAFVSQCVFEKGHLPRRRVLMATGMTTATVKISATGRLV